MGSTSIHNKIINAAARSALRPLGVKQKGQSRFWFDDRKWHALMIEFQPSAWAKGSYLNTSVSWLWYPKDGWSFDADCTRASGFTEYEDEEQFEAATQAMAKLAADYVVNMRSNVTSLEAAYDLAVKDAKSCWPAFHAGLLASVIGKHERADELLSSAFEAPAEYDWMRERNDYITALLGRVGDVGACASFVEDKIAAARAKKKLPALEAPLLPRLQ